MKGLTIYAGFIDPYLTLGSNRPGGAEPVCYEKDVTQKMVDEYRRKTEK